MPIESAVDVLILDFVHLDNSSYRPLDPNGVYIIQESPRKGLGVFVARDVVRGTRIMVDKPFFVVRKTWNESRVVALFETMPLEQRLRFMGLRCPDRWNDPHL